MNEPREPPENLAAVAGDGQYRAADDENAHERAADDRVPEIEPADESQLPQADGDESRSPDVYEDEPGPRVQDLDDDEDKREVAKSDHEQDTANRPAPDEEPNQPPEEPLSIGGILPRYCMFDSECVVAVQFSPENARVSFCKFGNVIVRGSVKSDLRLYCKAPMHQAGRVNLSISRDGLQFFGAAVFTFERKGWLSLWIIGGAVAIIFGLVAGACLRKRAAPKKRRRKASRPGLAGKGEKAPVVTRRQPL
jgi:hypothetical protein